jgi:hypothetical protein
LLQCHALQLTSCLMLQFDSQCSIRTHTAATHSALLLMFTPQCHLHVFTLTANAIDTAPLPQSRVGANTTAPPVAPPTAEQPANEPTCEPLSALWREADLVPGATQMEEAELKMRVCRIMSFEGGPAVMAQRPDACARYTALAVDEARDRCVRATGLLALH